MTLAVRPIEPTEAALLPAIERDAASRFRTVGLDAIADGDTCSPAFIAAVMAHGIALGAFSDRSLVGFALAGSLDGGLHLYELSVAMAEGGRGIGSALLDGLDAAARRDRHAHLSLSTFADVAWNAPYYARRGFAIVAEAEWTPGFHLIRNAERAAGLPLEKRVFMTREIHR